MSDSLRGITNSLTTFDHRDHHRGPQEEPFKAVEKNSQCIKEINIDFPFFFQAVPSPFET
ncbi:hypothetical protein KR100_12435 [Synechococcus sp. KORDI-100]|nr:hypothetical protein KR100_12435 [Synechococcus sp. KORDI-100]